MNIFIVPLIILLLLLWFGDICKHFEFCLNSSNTCARQIHIAHALALSQFL